MPSPNHSLLNRTLILSNKTSSEVLQVLGDTADQNYPIYMWGTQAENGFTMHTALFDLDVGTLTVMAGNPKVTPPNVVAQRNLHVGWRYS